MDNVDKNGVVHDQPEHLTRKSHHSTIRDKPKHSGKVNVQRQGPRKGPHRTAAISITPCPSPFDCRLS